MLGIPLLLPLILISKKRRKTVFYRLGFGLPNVQAELPVAHGPVWVHALSVGEVLSAVALVKALRQEFHEQPVVFSVSTYTGYKIAQNRLGSLADAVFFFPFDIPFAVVKAFDKIGPSLVVIVETDIWPNFMHEMNRRSVPVLLINARLSDRSFKQFKHFKFFSNRLLSLFATICTQSHEDTGRFVKLGIDDAKIITTGNIKFDQDNQTISAGEQFVLKEQLHIGPDNKVVVAGSTHEGEEILLRDAFRTLKKLCAGLKMIVVPRDPERSGQIENLCSSVQIQACRLSECEEMGFERFEDVLIVDRIGELARLYALADIVFIGGSLVRQGGHNPLEAAMYAKPVLFGPDMSDFRHISSEMTSAGAALTVNNAAELYRATAELLQNEDLAVEMGKRAFQLFNSNKGALQLTVQEILKVYKTFYTTEHTSEQIRRWRL